MSLSSKPITTLVLMSGLFGSFDALAAGSCVFYAPNSVNYWTSYPSSSIYGDGPLSFAWEPETGRVLSGYYTGRATCYSPVLTFFNNLSSGSISGTIGSYLNLKFSMSFTRTVPDSYSFSVQGGTLTGTPSSARFRGYADGPYLLEATGTVTCN
jgi:hypothetical protein